jgi:hypothetical protein
MCQPSSNCTFIGLSQLHHTNFYLRPFITLFFSRWGAYFPLKARSNVSCIIPYLKVNAVRTGIKSHVKQVSLLKKSLDMTMNEIQQGWMIHGL